jgi:amino acid adenylation domain-containing protein
MPTSPSGSETPSASTRRSWATGVRFTVAPEVARAVLDLGATVGATPFMTLLAATFVVLDRHTGRQDLVVGTPVSGRTHAELEDVVGCFINTLVLRGDLSGDPSLGEVVDRVRRTTPADYAHQNLPFERLVADLAPERGPAHNPLFQVLFAVYDASEPRWPGELAVRHLPVATNSAKVDLEISFARERDGSLTGSLEFAIALFDRARMVHMAGHLERVLSAMADRPATRLSELEVLTSEERRLLLREWQSPPASAPVAGCLHEWITAQAARTPDAVAVRCGANRLTYAGLETRANQVAHRLIELGVHTETPVAILCDRGLPLLPAILGVLKAGGHFVPLNGSDPPDRLDLLLRDCGARVVLTTSAFRDRLPQAPALCLEDCAEAPETPPAVSVDPDNLVYVMYTSGSTGRPKGVMITHRGVLNYLTWCGQAYQADGGAAVHSPLSFDLTVTALFLPLLRGQTVTLLPSDENVVTGLAATLTGRRFGLVKVTPAHLALLSRCLPASAAAAANHLVVGGEQLTGQALAFWRTHAPHVVVTNEYGPTETTVAVVAGAVPAGEVRDGPVPIGRPIRDTTVYLLDGDLRPVPIGAAGELFVGGAGVARGYAGRPGLTAERYLPNPFGGGRLYRTGDLGRHLPDGRISYLGRLDDQVKIRGFRVEPGEIEARLLAHPAVRRVRVVVREDVPADQRLVGYLVLHDGVAAPDTEELREFCGRVLPGFMVPVAFVVLPSLPLTANGKLDRAALPAPRAPRPPELSEVDGPMRAVALVWQQALGRPVGVDEDFFELGGHSLLAVTVVDRLNRELGTALRLADLFRAPTVRRLCARLHGEAGAADEGLDGCVVPMRPGEPGTPALFLVPPTAGTPFAYLALARELDRRIPLYGLQALGYDAGEDPLTSVAEIARRYLDGVLAIAGDEPVRLLGWSFGGVAAFEMARQLEAAGGLVGHLCLIDATVAGVDALAPVAEPDADDPLGWYGRVAFGLPPDELADRDPTDLLIELLGEQRYRSMGLSAASDSQMLERIARVSAASSRAIRAYRCAAVLRTDIHLIRPSEEHPTRTAPRVRAESWRKHTTGTVRVSTVPGNHWNLVDPPYAAALARAVQVGLGMA